MSTFNDYGIILHNYKLSESDKILSIYTKNNGLVKAVCKGTRKLASSFGSKVEQLSCCYFQFARGKNLYTICECEQVNSFSLLRSNLIQINCGILFLEVVNRFSYEGEFESELIYNLLYSSLDKLQKHIDPYLLTTEFLLEFLSIHGYKPQLDTCVACSIQIKSYDTRITYPYSAQLGGLLCTNCSKTVDYKAVSHNILEVLQSLENQKNEEINKEDIRPTLNLLREHIDLRAKNTIKSFELLLSL